MTLTRRRTKTDYLDTALSLANERSSGVPYAYAVAHVDVAQVAEAAGVSRAALYRLWETQESFRADLAAYLAAQDDAPLYELARTLLNTTQAELGADPHPLLRAGIAGYPDASSLTAVIAERERWRLARHAALVDRALRSTGRRCLPGLTPADISLVTNAVADGIALATRMTPPDLPLVVGPDSPRPWTVLALAVCELFDGMSQPGRQPHSETRPPAQPPRPSVDYSGRRLDYLRLAAELARREHSQAEPADSCALGYVSLDALARAEGVTRAAVRKLWPTQAAFRPDLFAHLLTRHRQSVAEAMTRAASRVTAAGSSDGEAEVKTAGDVLLRVGDELFEQVELTRRQVSHLSFAPQFVLPSFRSYIHHHNAPLLDSIDVALTELLRAAGRRPRPGLDGRRGAVLVLAFVDGMTRVSRTLPEMVRDDVALVLHPSSDTDSNDSNDSNGCGDSTDNTGSGSRHSLLAVAFEKLLLRSSLPLSTSSADNPAH
jgi:AcrR family transcriptional regulator